MDYFAYYGVIVVEGRVWGQGDGIILLVLP